MTEASHSIADAERGSLVTRFMPQALLPYAQLMRLDRPVGWWLLLLPCWWGLLLAQAARGDAMPNLWFAFLFLAGAIIMRGAGCTLNDIVDRNIDGRVARTRGRPIASGRVSVVSALAFCAILCILGLLVLVQFNAFTIMTGIASLLIVAVYPFMKRITYWPQAVLGLAFNWGALVGWTAVTGTLAPAALLLYAGGFFWTLAYDTIYACQDMEEDALIGVKSTALKFGRNAWAWLGAFFAASILCLDAAVWLAGGSLFSHAGVALAALHAIWQLRRFDISRSELALQLFKSNRVFGLLIAGGFLMDVMA
jgi:4-hydroxybenzoate polyprenyltransferase